MCTCIYFAEIVSFDGEKILAPPHDLSVDPDNDHDMVDAEDHDQDDASADKHPPAGAPILPFARRGRPET